MEKMLIKSAGMKKETNLIANNYFNDFKTLKQKHTK